VAQGVPSRLRPRIFFTFRHYKGGRSSAKRTGRLYPRRNPWYSLSEAESTSGHMVLSGVPRKKSPVTPPILISSFLNFYHIYSYVSLPPSQYWIPLLYRCPRRNVPDFGRVFLMLNYTDITQNTYIQS